MKAFNVRRLFPKFSFSFIFSLSLCVSILIYQINIKVCIILTLLSLLLLFQFILSQKKVLEVTFDGDDQWRIKLNLNNQIKVVKLGSKTKVWKDLILFSFVDENNKSLLFIIERPSLTSIAWRELSMNVRSL